MLTTMQNTDNIKYAHFNTEYFVSLFIPDKNKKRSELKLFFSGDPPSLYDVKSEVNHTF